MPIASSTTIIPFYGKFDELSNFYPATFTHERLIYKSSEQAYQATKARFFGDTASWHAILRTDDPVQIKRIGKTVANFDRTRWRLVANSFMKAILKSKFSQNQHLKDFLLSTGDKILVEANPHDTYWGIGISKRDLFGSRKNSKRKFQGEFHGHNHLGQILGELRSEFRQQLNQP